MPKENKGSSLKNSLVKKGLPKSVQTKGPLKNDTAKALAQGKHPNLVKKKTHVRNIQLETPIQRVEERLTLLKKEPLNFYSNYQAKTQNPVYTGYSKLDEIRLISVGLASSNRILQWAEKSLPNGKIVGEVTNANTLHHKTFKPVKGGLFCERIFGPLKDFECACSSSLGKKMKNLKKAGEHAGHLGSAWSHPTMARAKDRYKQGDLKNPLAGIGPGLSNFTGKRFFCPACDVEYTWSVIRRYQLGYIKLNAPVTHVWYVKGNPSYISLLLDMKKKHVEYVTYCTETLTLENSLKFSVENLYTLSETGLEAQPNELYAAWEKVAGSSVKPILDVNNTPGMLAESEKFLQTSFSNSNKPFTNITFGELTAVPGLHTGQSQGAKTLIKESSKEFFRNRLPHRGTLENGLKYLNYYLPYNSRETKGLPPCLAPASSGPRMQALARAMVGAAWSPPTMARQGDDHAVPASSCAWSEVTMQSLHGSRDRRSRPYKPVQTKYLLGPKVHTFDKVLTHLSYPSALYKKSELEASLKLKNLSALVALQNGKIKHKGLAPSAITSQGPTNTLLKEFTKAVNESSVDTSLQQLFKYKSNFWFAYFCIVIKNLKKCRIASLQHALKIRLLRKISFTTKYKLLTYLLLNNLKATSLSLKTNPLVFKQSLFTALEDLVSMSNLTQTFKFNKISFLADATVSETIISKMNASCKSARLKTNKVINFAPGPAWSDPTMQGLCFNPGNNIFLSTVNLSNLVRLVFLFKNTKIPLNLGGCLVAFDRGHGHASLTIQGGKQQNVRAVSNLTTTKELVSAIWEKQNKAISNILFMNKLAKAFSTSLNNITTISQYKPKVLTSFDNSFALYLKEASQNVNAKGSLDLVGEQKRSVSRIWAEQKHIASFTQISRKASIFNSIKIAGLHRLVPALFIKQPKKGFNDLTKLVNNIYCLSHRLLWDNEKDWQFFAFYYYGFYSFIKNVPSFVTEKPSNNMNSDRSSSKQVNQSKNLKNKVPGSASLEPTMQGALENNNNKLGQDPVYRQPLNLEDSVVPIYAYRNYSDQFSLLNTFFSGFTKPDPYLAMVDTEYAGPGPDQEKPFTAWSTPTMQAQLHVSFSGAGMIKTLLADFHYLELKKMDKQNRILLYDLNKYIRKMKKQITQNKKLVKAVKELCKQRDILIRRTKYIRKIFRNYVGVREHAGNFSLALKSPTMPGVGHGHGHGHGQAASSNRFESTSNTSLNNMGRLADLILEVLPVLPPDLRPIVKMGSQIAASDLNRLYQRVIYRNDRLKKFLKNPATNGSYEMKYAQRLLQEAVDNLIQNGKSGVVPEKDARGRSLKSLSDILKGKQGRFRQYLLGKRVDYSGRSVIVVGPKLKLHECGIPKEMALELYLPFLIKSILNKNLARTVIGAKALIQNNKPLTWSLLREILKTCPVLLNRAPTLHRLGFQAFQPKLVDGRAILLHPLVCPAFNADFDGDQMAVHVPISAEARAEAWKLMLSRNNLLSPATGEPLVLPSQDMVLGCYYLTTNGNKFSREFEKGFGFYFDSLSDVLRAYNQALLSIHAIIWLKWNAPYEQVSNLEAPLEIRLNNTGSGGYVIYPKSYKTFQIHKQNNAPYLQLPSSQNSQHPPCLALAMVGGDPAWSGPTMQDHATPALAASRSLTGLLNNWVLPNKTDHSRKWATELILVNNVIQTTPGKILFNIMLQNSLTS